MITEAERSEIEQRRAELEERYGQHAVERLLEGRCPPILVTIMLTARKRHAGIEKVPEVEVERVETGRPLGAGFVERMQQRDDRLRAAAASRVRGRGDRADA